MRTPTKFILSTIAATLALAVPAGAQELGVHVDPGSPAGKEYGIPLEQARGNTGAGESGGSGGAGAFGAGIEAGDDQSGPPRAARGDRSSAAGGTSRGRPGATAAPSATLGGQAGPSSPPQSGATSSLPGAGGGSAAALSALVAFGVLAGGTVLGLGLRRLRVR